ncbi:hypothetical protein [Clostridium sp.]|jgi:hypothetical protein|uniref:hypothetical protein n=1 Tax=Clostridium sp. TaxID=1506 RepID=UPI003EEB7FBA
MKAVYIYNPNSLKEISLIERAKEEMKIYVEEIEVVGFEVAKTRFNIRATPAIIFIRDDLQGINLLDEVNGKLRIVGELCKVLQEEELNIHQMDTNRIDNLINIEVAKGQNELMDDMIIRGVI